MRKLIRFSAVAFLVWAITTFAWAALSHIAGTAGPARASAASMELVANAVTFIDPPGALGAPQRFAARQIRGAARAVESFHRVPERAMADLVDALGHRHRHGRRGGRRHAEYTVAQERSFAIPIDELDRVRSRARELAQVELKLHRGQLDRARAEMERRRGDVERRRGEMERRRGELERRRGELERRRADLHLELESRERERIARSIERITETIRRAAADQDGDFRRKLEEKLREILRDLQEELEDFDAGAAEAIAELDGLELSALEDLDVEGPIRIRIRNR